MKEMEICRHLDAAFEAFLELIPSHLHDALRENVYFAGGCIYCLRNDKEPKDYDMFLMSDELISELSELDIWRCTSEYALTTGKYQIVIKYFGDPCECVREFDFKHNMYYYIPFSSRICSVNYEEEDKPFEDWDYLVTLELHFNESRARDIEGVWLRVDKFVKRGMTISKETKKKIRSRTTRKAVKQYKKRRKYNKNYY